MNRTIKTLLTACVLISIIVFTSCKEEIKTYNDSFNVTYISDIDFDAAIHGSHILIEDSTVILNYSSEDEILHVIYNGEDHVFNNIKMEDLYFVQYGIEAKGKVFKCGNDTILDCQRRGSNNEELIWMNKKHYYN